MTLRKIYIFDAIKLILKHYHLPMCWLFLPMCSTFIRWIRVLINLISPNLLRLCSFQRTIPEFFDRTFGAFFLEIDDRSTAYISKKGNYLEKFEVCQQRCHPWSWRAILDFGWFETERSRFPLHWHHFPDYWKWHVEIRRNGSLRQLKNKYKEKIKHIK